MSVLPIHCIGDKRLCGATTIDTGKQTKVFVEGKLAAVEGDKDDHNNLGDLISLGPGKVKIQGQKAIASLIDQGAPDQLGIIPHVTGLPTPAEGSQKVKIGMGVLGNALGMLGGGRGSKNGRMDAGENVLASGQKVGDIYRIVDGGSAGFDVLVLANVSNTVANGTSVTGQSTGNTFTFSSYASSQDPILHETGSNTAVTSGATANVFAVFSGYAELSVITASATKLSNGYVFATTTDDISNLRDNDYIKFENYNTANTAVYKLTSANVETQTVSFNDTQNLITSSPVTVIMHISDVLGASDGYDNPVNVRLVSHVDRGRYFVYPSGPMKTTGYTDFTEVVNTNYPSKDPVRISITHFDDANYGFISVRTYDKDGNPTDFDTVKYKMT